ncbi:MAG: 50S ribosomal protein L18 [Thermodesulfobacteriota bacterium]
MGKTTKSKLAWQKRQVRVRQKVRGTAQRPRLCVYRSLNNIYAQIIDDGAGATLVEASSRSQEIRALPGHKGNVAAAKEVGKVIAQRAKTKGIKQVVFDRNGFLYHGRVKALAEAAREEGLEF